MKKINASGSFSQISKQIMLCAYNSYVGEMRYDKWDREQKRLVNERLYVVPLDYGINSTHNQILYAMDYRDHNQVKMFIVKRIRDFVATKRRVHTFFPIRIQHLKKIFGDIENERDNENQNGIDEDSQGIILER